MLLSVILTICFEIASLLISKRFDSKKQLSLAESNDAEKMFDTLLTTPNPLNFFYDMFKTRHKLVEKHKEYLIIKSQEGNQTLVFPFLKIKSLDIDDVLQIIKLKKNISKIIIICNDYSPLCQQYKYNHDSELLILNKHETYSSLYKEYDYYPQIINNTQVKKKYTVKNIFHLIFNKTKLKGYLIFGLILFVYSIYAPYSILYKIMASTLLIFALISAFSSSTLIKKELV